MKITPVCANDHGENWLYEDHVLKSFQCQLNILWKFI